MTAKQDLSPLVDIATALQALIEVAQRGEDRDPTLSATVTRARRARASLSQWIEEAKYDDK